VEKQQIQQEIAECRKRLEELEQKLASNKSGQRFIFTPDYKLVETLHDDDLDKTNPITLDDTASGTLYINSCYWDVALSKHGVYTMIDIYRV
jgi:phosphopantetheine adenylyltransferase